jgi:hypothetical protein
MTRAEERYNNFESLSRGRSQFKRVGLRPGHVPGVYGGESLGKAACNGKRARVAKTLKSIVTYFGSTSKRKPDDFESKPATTLCYLNSIDLLKERYEQSNIASGVGGDAGAEEGAVDGAADCFSECQTPRPPWPLPLIPDLPLLYPETTTSGPEFLPVLDIPALRDCLAAC